MLVDGVISDAIWPRRGILAGATAATYQLKALLVRHLRLFVKRHPLVNFVLHVDDAVQDTTSHNELEAAQTISNSTEDLRRVFEEDLRLPIAYAKARSLANVETLLETVKRSLGRLAGQAVPCSPESWCRFCCPAPQTAPCPVPAIGSLPWCLGQTQETSSSCDM